MPELNPSYIRRLVESSPDIVIAVDRNGTIIYYNDGARENLGFTSAEVIGENCTRIYPTLEEARRVMKAMRESGEGGRISSFETVFRNKQGDVIPVAISGSIIYDESGREVGSIGFARDVRRMRQRQQLATAGEIAVSLAHEINNPLESITNNLDLLKRSIAAHLSEAEKAVDRHRFEAIRASIRRVQAIVRRLEEMARKGVYETRDYMEGKRMADLTPRRPRVGQPSAADRTPSDDSEEWPLSGMRVLVLDDDLSVVNSMADLLRAERCVAHCATLPSSALGILRNVRIDAVISDVVMPEMDGYDFYMRVKEEMPDMPIILMTAYYYDKDHVLKRTRMRGLEGAIFKKPINPAKLRSLLLQIRHKESTPAGAPTPPGRRSTPHTRPKP